MQLVGLQTDMLEWNFLLEASVGETPPAFSVPGPDSPEVFILTEGEQLIEFSSPDSGRLELDYYSKKETDTVVQDGKIIRDTMWRIKKIWCDGILLESWFLNDCCYRPCYFKGYMESYPDAPSKIFAPYQFNFPGTLSWNWQEGDFWQWYFHEKNRREVIHFVDKDPDRVWKFRGSTEECHDLVRSIRELLRL